MVGTSYDRLAGWLSLLAGVAGIGYAVFFVALKNQYPGVTALFLTLAPLLAVAGLVAVYERVRDGGPGFAVLALALGAYGSLAASTHGAYDLANVLHAPSGLPQAPFPADPRGYGTFALTGLSLLLLSSLARRSPGLPGWVGPLGMLLGAFLVLTWLGRLIVLDAGSLLVLGPALVSGLLSPAFFLGLGAWLLGWRR